jgi:hypothetical protein
MGEFRQLLCKKRDTKSVCYIIPKTLNLNLQYWVNGPPLWSSGQSSWLQNRGVLCFLWGTNWIYICYVEESRPPLWSSGQSSWLQNGGVLCFLWGTNWIYKCYVEKSIPPLWSSGQSSWLQIRRPGFDSRHYQKKKYWVWNGIHSASWVQLRSYLIEK